MAYKKNRKVPYLENISGSVNELLSS